MISSSTHYKEGIPCLFYNMIIRDDNKKSKRGKAGGTLIEKNMQEKKPSYIFPKRDNFLGAIAAPKKV